MPVRLVGTGEGPDDPTVPRGDSANRILAPRAGDADRRGITSTMRRRCASSSSARGSTSTRPRTATQALAAVREDAPDLVLLDMSIPGTAGPEVLKAIKSDLHVAGAGHRRHGDR